MKRKRGHKKGSKSKKSTEPDKLNESSVQDSESEQSCEKSEHESKTEVSSTPSGNSPNVVDPVKSVGRVKVKLKTSKAAPEPPDLPLPPTKTSSPEKPVEKKEETVPPPLRLPERKPVLNVYRKMKGIKIKSWKAADASSSATEKSSVDTAAVKAQDAVSLDNDTTTKTPDESSQVKMPEPESAPVSSQNQQKKTDQVSRYNKQELEESLTVVKKIMKMEAADPFNVPVDPEALGIPDYFDIIKTPMDFGTVCSNLEKGNIYMNSEDVYKDVQYIWNNCSKYNKKGDYIVDLMKRVKKNFMKYWASAGLYTEQSPENGQVEDGGNASSKGSQSKQKSQKRHGRHHKSDCMCAVCILKRRKRERHSSQGNSGAVEDMDVDVDNRTGQGKTEIVELDSPVAKRQRVGENVEEVETLEVESETKTKPTVEDKTQSIDRSTDETGDEPVTSAADKLVVLASVEGPKSTQIDEEEKAKRLREQKELQELERKQWRAKMHEKFQLRNPQLLNLCESIFPNSKNHSSVWNGPHSLFKRPEGSNRTSSLHKAVESLMRSSN
ncbi:DNA-binding bromodomain-containing protein [Hirschfeldia incana]|nr:DNA-binding bromodomain-containing protein [Hirschfeldia incana]